MEKKYCEDNVPLDIYMIELQRKDDDSDETPNYKIKEFGNCFFSNEEKEELIREGLKALRRTGDKFMKLEQKLDVPFSKN